MKWDEYPISTFCKTSSGGTPSRSKPEYYNGTIPWVKSGELKEAAVLSASEHITEQAIKESSAKVAPAGALLVAMYGATIGRVAYLGMPAATNQAVCNIIPDESKADRQYLFYALRSKAREWISRGAGGAQPNISQKIIQKTKIYLPPLEEQKRIAAILDKADAIRKKRKQAIELTDQFLRSAFLDMFGDPVTNPKGWKKVSLGQITHIDAPMVDPREKEYSNLIHIGPDRIEKNTGKILPALTAAEEGLISKKFLFDQRYILYTKIRPYLRKVAHPTFSGLCSADMYPVRPNETYITKEFLWMVLISSAFVSYFNSLPERASIPKINRKEFAEFQCIVPPLEHQQNYSNLLKTTARSKKAQTNSMHVSNDMFNALVQRTFRGDM